MDIGTYIKILRKEKKLSQEELGSMLIPSVNRAAINKWETGKVENIKRTHIKQLAKIFDVSPVDLLCFDEDCSSSCDDLLSRIQKKYGKECLLLIESFLKLNKNGKEKVLENLTDLLQIDKYIEKKEIKDA